MSSEFSKINKGLTTILDPAGLTPKAAKAMGVDTAGLPGFEEPMQGAGTAGQTEAMPLPPTRDEQQAVIIRRREAAKQRARGGRASTILTGSETLG
jgi:hypothetical protein